MRLLLIALTVLLPASLSAQTYYDQQRQTREYKNLSEATQRAYSVPNQPAPSTPAYRPSTSSSSSSSSSSGSYYNTPSTNDAAQQLADQWRRNAGKYTPVERAEIERQRAYDAEQGRQYAARERARIAEANAKQNRINRDAELEAIYSRERRNPEQARQYSYDSAAVPLRQFARATGVHDAERHVYIARMNPFTKEQGLSANGVAQVKAAMQAHSEFLTQCRKADYETLMKLMDAFVILPVSTLHGAKAMAKRFPERRSEIMRAELRAINFFFGDEFTHEYRRQRTGLRLEDTMETRWRAIYAKMPEDAVEAMKAVTEWQYNPVAQFADGCIDFKRRLEYYTLLMQVQPDDPERWLKYTVPDQHWEDWKKTWPEGFIVAMLEQNPGMVLAITKRSKALADK